MRALACLFFFLFASVWAALAPASPAHAHGGEPLRIIRDTEIENGLHELAGPVIAAAGYSVPDIRFIIVNSRDLNAFVAGGMNIFLYTALIQQSDHPGQLVGVIAHELGHIAGGHLVRGRAAMRDANIQRILGAAAALAAGIAAGAPQAGLFVLGGSEDAAMRSFFAHSRAQEGTADAAALQYLDTAKMSAAGLAEFMEKLVGQELLPYDRQSEWVRTHPISQDRLAAIRAHLSSSRYADQPIPAAAQETLNRIKGKLLGFLQPENALLRYTDKDQRVWARYARAVALFRTNQLPRALAIMDDLLRLEPSNPYWHEMKAQMLLENSRPLEAVNSYQRAVDLLPAAPLIRVALARAQLQSGRAELLAQAAEHVLYALEKEPGDPDHWRQLATIWGRAGEAGQEPNAQGLVAYALAEEAMSADRPQDALSHAKRALELLPRQNPYWVRASDVRLAAEQANKDK